MYRNYYWIVEGYSTVLCCLHLTLWLIPSALVGISCWLFCFGVLLNLSVWSLWKTNVGCACYCLHLFCLRLVSFFCFHHVLVAPTSVSQLDLVSPPLCSDSSIYICLCCSCPCAVIFWLVSFGCFSWISSARFLLLFLFEYHHPFVQNPQSIFACAVVVLVLLYFDLSHLDASVGSRQPGFFCCSCLAFWFVFDVLVGCYSSVQVLCAWSCCFGYGPSAFCSSCCCPCCCCSCHHCLFATLTCLSRQINLAGNSGKKQLYKC